MRLAVSIEPYCQGKRRAWREARAREAATGGRPGARTPSAEARRRLLAACSPADSRFCRTGHRPPAGQRADPPLRPAAHHPADGRAPVRGPWHGLPLALDRADRASPAAGGRRLEDQRFCEHHGFDFDAMEKAMKTNERRPSKLRGGSTGSQQTAKNVFLWPGRSYVRKGDRGLVHGADRARSGASAGSGDDIRTSSSSARGSTGAEAASERFLPRGRRPNSPRPRPRASPPSCPSRWPGRPPRRGLISRAARVISAARWARCGPMGWRAIGRARSARPPCLPNPSGVSRPT